MDWNDSWDGPTEWEELLDSVTVSDLELSSAFSNLLQANNWQWRMARQTAGSPKAPFGTPAQHYSTPLNSARQSH